MQHQRVAHGGADVLAKVLDPFDRIEHPYRPVDSKSSRVRIRARDSLLPSRS